MLYLQDDLGCQNINFVSPSHFVPQLVQAVLEAVPMGLRVPLVYNTNGYDSIASLRELDDINHYEHREHHPMLSAVVIVQAENKAGSGFFECARNLGVFQGGDELAFWVKELNRVWDYWSSH